MRLSNTQAKQQHEKCAKILDLAMTAKAMSNRNLCIVNRLTSQGRAYDGFGRSIYEFRSEQRRWQQIYERLKKYYSNQLLKLISEDYVNVNSFATL